MSAVELKRGASTKNVEIKWDYLNRDYPINGLGRMLG